MESEEITELVRRARAGEEAAWNAIVAEYANLVGWVVRSFRLGEFQAADAVQTTWLRLVEHLDSVREPDHLAGWLRTTARRVCLEIVRESGRECLVDTLQEWQEDALGRSRGGGDNVETDLVRAEHRRLVRAALDTFPERERTLLTLLATEDVSYKEISARLGMPIGSIGPTRTRLLARLRSALRLVGVTDGALH
jgi:RNA polymerase sigma factor (sigma-70 family)